MNFACVDISVLPDVFSNDAKNIYVFIEFDFEYRRIYIYCIFLYNKTLTSHRRIWTKKNRWSVRKSPGKTLTPRVLNCIKYSFLLLYVSEKLFGRSGFCSVAVISARSLKYLFRRSKVAPYRFYLGHITIFHLVSALQQNESSRCTPTLYIRTI